MQTVCGLLLNGLLADSNGLIHRHAPVVSGLPSAAVGITARAITPTIGIGRISIAGRRALTTHRRIYTTDGRIPIARPPRSIAILRNPSSVWPTRTTHIPPHVA